LHNLLYVKPMQDQIRSGDCFGRYGGEEFLLLLRDMGLAETRRFVERIRHCIEGLEIGGPEQLLCVTVSAGDVQHRPGEAGAQTISRADIALYAAKAAGRNRITPETACVVKRKIPNSFAVECLH
jgi:diguanylate cyclase